MTKRKAVLKIIEQKGLCANVGCGSCPLYDEDCGTSWKALALAKEWLEKYPEGGIMLKDEALKRLDALDAEAKKLREILNKPEKEAPLVYDRNNMYVMVIDEKSYLLVGQAGTGYFRWHSFYPPYPTEMGWTLNKSTGQEALDIVQGGDIHVFSDTKEGIRFFYEMYTK